MKTVDEGVYHDHVHAKIDDGHDKKDDELFCCIGMPVIKRPVLVHEKAHHYGNDERQSRRRHIPHAENTMENIDTGNLDESSRSAGNDIPKSDVRGKEFHATHDTKASYRRLIR